MAFFFFSLVFPACLRATDFPTVWIFREPLISARPWPSQQDLEHLATPHDCHHLCVAFTTGSCPIDGCSRWWASGNQRNRSFFFSWTQWECVGCTLLSFCFFSILFSLFLSLWYFCPSQKNSGMDQTRISLIWPFFCCISIYWSFIWMIGRCSEEKSWSLNKNEWLSGWPFSFICLSLIVILISSQERIIDAIVPRWLKRHFNVELCTDFHAQAFFRGERSG